MPKAPEPTEVVFGPRSRAASFIVAAVLVAAGTGVAIPIAMSARRAPHPSAVSSLPTTPSLTPLPSPTPTPTPSPSPSPTNSVAPVETLDQPTNARILLAGGGRLIEVDVDARTTRTAFNAPAGLTIDSVEALDDAFVVIASDYELGAPRLRSGIYLLPKMPDGTLGAARTLIAAKDLQDAWAFASQTPGRIWIAHVPVVLDECSPPAGPGHLYEVDLEGNVTTRDRSFNADHVNPSVSVPGGFLSHDDDLTCNGTSVVHRLDENLRIVRTILPHNAPCAAGEFAAETRRSLLIAARCSYEEGTTKLSVLDFLTGKTQRFDFPGADDIRFAGSDPAGRTLAIMVFLPRESGDFENGYLQIVRGGHTERVTGSEARWHFTGDDKVAYQSHATVTPSGRWVFYVNSFYELRAYAPGGKSYSVPVKLPRGFRPSILTAIDG